MQGKETNSVIERVWPFTCFFLLFSAHPKITSENQTVIKLVGQSVKIYCNSSGIPKASTTILKEYNSTRFEVVSSNYVYELPNIQLKDAGLYKCVAENVVGKALTYIQVKVLGEYKKDLKTFFQHLIRRSSVKVVI